MITFSSYRGYWLGAFVTAELNMEVVIRDGLTGEVITTTPTEERAHKIIDEWHNAR